MCISIRVYTDGITTAIEIISALLLFSEIIFITLYCRKLIRASFFKCFVFNGCFGMLSWAVSFQLLRGIGAKSLNYLAILMLLSGLSLHGYLISSFLTSLNRFNAIVFPQTFEKMWRTRKILTFFLVIITCSVLSVYFRIGVPIEAVWLEEQQYYRWLGYPPEIHKTALIVTLSICFFVSIASLLINICSLLSWRKYREGVTSQMRAAQKNLFCFSILSFLCSFLICWQQLSANLVKFQGNQALATVIFDLYFPISTFAIFVEPYAIIYFSSALRKEIAKFFGRGKSMPLEAFTFQRSTGAYAWHAN